MHKENNHGGALKPAVRRRDWRRIHHSPLFWVGALLFIAAITIYVLSVRPHERLQNLEGRDDPFPLFGFIRDLKLRRSRLMRYAAKGSAPLGGSRSKGSRILTIVPVASGLDATIAPPS